MAIGEDFELGEVLLILAAVGVGAYLLYKAGSSFLASAACLTKVGAIPGVTGATQGQVCAPKIAASNLKPGGAIVWTCSSDSNDYDYAQPCGDVVQVRTSWNPFKPVTYTTVPRDQYVRPAGGVQNPAFACCYGCTPATAAGNPSCCGGKNFGAFGGPATVPTMGPF